MGALSQDRLVLATGAKRCNEVYPEGVFASRPPRSSGNASVIVVPRPSATVDLQMATMPFGDGVGDGQAESGALYRRVSW